MRVSVDWGGSIPVGGFVTGDTDVAAQFSAVNSRVRYSL